MSSPRYGGCGREINLYFWDRNILPSESAINEIVLQNIVSLTASRGSPVGVCIQLKMEKKILLNAINL